LGIHQSIGLGLKLGADLVASLVVGLILGYWVDVFFNTTPIFIVIFILLGAVAWFRHIMRKANDMINNTSSTNHHA
jgi:ATP synthase protein I